ncbi:uncharacterized protein N7458_008462 [Penicillium daleae]|uniref:Uncharacterized protein n=1 Tax=Penicillium daleae TaxID=63821 RepID=A0AAD6C4V8_9EURO|nr:uncharacterized protein N7458_008462 [Penicillium daleae]KAJ5444590.1 hypothetical protein N7458_008462 [Penicillium daleae]
MVNSGSALAVPVPYLGIRMNPFVGERSRFWTPPAWLRAVRDRGIYHVRVCRYNSLEPHETEVMANLDMSKVKDAYSAL